ncbi:hypothetical protein ACJX0J_003507 (mitochondrion) [Zea mays]
MNQKYFAKVQPFRYGFLPISSKELSLFASFFSLFLRPGANMSGEEKIRIRMNFHSFFHDEYCEEIEPDDTKNLYLSSDEEKRRKRIKKKDSTSNLNPTLKAMTLRATTDEKTRSYNADDSDYERLVEFGLLCPDLVTASSLEIFAINIFAFLLRLLSLANKFLCYGMNIPYQFVIEVKDFQSNPEDHHQFDLWDASRTRLNCF